MSDFTNKYLEENAVNSPVKNIEWEVNHIQTESIQIKDPGTGKGTIIRSFFFKGIPTPPGMPKPTKADVISQFKGVIEKMLWSDGLHAIPEATVTLYTKSQVKKFPSLKAKMLEENADFVIMVAAESNGGVITDLIHRAT